MSADCFRLGIAPLDPQHGHTEENLHHLGDAVHSAADQGAQLSVAPEPASSSYGFAGQPEAASCSEPWGKIGLLICADAYYSSAPRALALRGAPARTESDTEAHPIGGPPHRSNIRLAYDHVDREAMCRSVL